MPVAFESSATGGGFPPGSPSFTQGISAGTNRTALLAVMTVGGGAAPTVTATYNAVAMTQIAQASATIFGRFIATTLFQMLDANLPALTGGYPMVYTSATPYDSRAYSCVYTGVQQVLAPTAGLSNSNNPPLSGFQTVNIAGVSPAGMVLDFFGAEPSAGPITSFPGALQVERSDTSDLDTLLAASEKPYSGSGLQSMTQTPSGSYFAFAYLAAVLQEVAAASATRSAFLLGTQG